jgi:hypothetical protein
MVLLMALIVLAEHVTVFALLSAGHMGWLISCTRMCQFVLIGALFWYNRGTRVLPTSAPERELWSIWIGYLVAYAVSHVVGHTLIARGLIAPGPEAPAAWADLILYPVSATLSGLAFFVMGSNYWGRCYAVGVLFFGLAFAITFALPLAPLAFGLLWSATLLALGLHLRRLGSRGAGGPQERLDSL